MKIDMTKDRTAALAPGWRVRDEFRLLVFRGEHPAPDGAVAGLPVLLPAGGGIATDQDGLTLVVHAAPRRWFLLTRDAVTTASFEASGLTIFDQSDGHVVLGAHRDCPAARAVIERVVAPHHLEVFVGDGGARWLRIGGVPTLIIDDGRAALWIVVARSYFGHLADWLAVCVVGEPQGAGELAGRDDPPARQPTERGEER